LLLESVKFQLSGQTLNKKYHHQNRMNAPPTPFPSEFVPGFVPGFAISTAKFQQL
jgi:hypothetical protein